LPSSYQEPILAIHCWSFVVKKKTQAAQKTALKIGQKTRVQFLYGPSPSHVIVILLCAALLSFGICSQFFATFLATIVCVFIYFLYFPFL